MDVGTIRPILGFRIEKKRTEEASATFSHSPSPCTPKSPLTEALKGSRSFNLPSLKIRHRRSLSEGSEATQITSNGEDEREGIPIPESRHSLRSAGSVASSSALYFAPSPANLPSGGFKHFKHSTEEGSAMEELTDIGDEELFDLEIPTAGLPCQRLKKIKIKI